MSTIFRDISAVDAMPSQMETSGRLFGLGAGKTTFRSGLFSQDNSRLNMQFGSSNNVDGLPDQRQRISSIQTTNLGMRSYGLQSRNSTVHSSVLQERSMLLNQEFKNKINNTSVISKPFWPAMRNTTLTTGLQMQDSVRYNDDVIDEGGFRRPSAVSRVIRGRNTYFSSRLFQNQNAERHYKDLSNINGFNVSHISRREDVDSLMESRFGLNMRNNGVDNQSMSGSVLSVVSMKAQFMNVLENLHHSILNIGPHVTAEAVRMEFDKAKQGLENISEMSFAASVKPSNAASVISQSSKYICPPIVESAASNTTNVINGGSVNLKTGKDILKTLISKKLNSTHVEEKGKGIVISSSKSKESDNEENSSFVFKKPQPYNRKRRSMKIKAPPAVKNSKAPKAASKVINLKQWYPIADGSDLAFCGVDENGETVKTEPVKKRLNNRKVELTSGVDCNLVGSPSAMVSVLPQKVAAFLRNGLTDRWRVLQKELSNCQTNHGEAMKRKSKSPQVKSPPVKKIQKPAEVKVNKRKAKSPKVISTPKKRAKVSELHTRSGRTVKPPAMFWLATGSDEVTSSMDAQEIDSTVQEVKTTVKSRSSSEGTSVKSKVKSPESKSRKVNVASPEKKGRNVNQASPEKKARNVNQASPERKSRKVNESSPERQSRKITESSPEKKSRKVNEASPEKKSRKASEACTAKKSGKVSEASPSKKASASPKKGRKAAAVATEENSFTKSKGKSSKAKNSPKQNKKKENKEEVKVHSSKETTKRQSKNWRGKRKGEVTAEVDSVQSKKSKIEKKTEVEVESTVKSTETKNAKKGKNELTPSPRSPKRRRQRNPVQRKKETVRKKTVKKVTESENEMNETMESERNFEFKLDDIEIPEIGNVSGNPLLSRSQLRLVSMETPPLKYFNNNLKLMRSVTPAHSPDWFTSQRTESEVKQFQRRREEAFKKRIKMNMQKVVVTTEKTKNVQNKDVKRVMEWVAEKTVKSPQWTSKVLQYVIPSRKQLEEEANNDDDEDFESDFL